MCLNYCELCSQGLLIGFTQLMDPTACMFNFYVQGPPGPGGLPGDLGKVGPPVSNSFALNWFWYYCVDICRPVYYDNRYVWPVRFKILCIVHLNIVVWASNIIKSCEDVGSNWKKYTCGMIMLGNVAAWVTPWSLILFQDFEYTWLNHVGCIGKKKLW